MKQPNQTITAKNPISTNIMDIHFDCLEPILKSLDLESLISMADTCNKLKPNIECIFTKKYGAKKITLDGVSRDATDAIKEERSSITISDISTILKFLRCFGHLISSLNVHPYSYYNVRYLSKIFQYMNKYCTNSITEIKFVNIKNWVMEVPFSKVEYITFSYCSLDERVADFKTWFPRVNSMEFFKVAKCAFIECHLPNLKSLVIPHWPLSRISQALDLNPQLRSIYCCKQLNANFLQEISKNLQNISVLWINLSPDAITPAGTVIHLKNVRCLSVTCLEEMVKLPFSFDSLQKCTLFVKKPDWSDVIRFIKTHPTLTYIDLCTSSVPEDLKSELFQELSKMETVDYVGYEFLIDEAIEFIKASKSLKSFRFKLRNDDFFILEKKLDKEWSRSIVNKCITLKR